MLKKTTHRIVESQNDYLMPIKGSNLRAVKEAAQIDWNDTTIPVHFQEEKAHGRTNTWTVRLLNTALPKFGFELYAEPTTLFQITRTDSRYHNPTVIYYLSNRKIRSPKACLDLVRNYWGIENDLHYNRDVLFNQDKNKIAPTNEAVIFAVFNTMAINILRKMVQQNLTNAIVWVRGNQTLFADKLKM
jgi:predicted transposase YbfD/YdcC